RKDDNAIRIAGDREGHAVAPGRRQSVGPAAFDHYAAVLRRLGAATREHELGGPRRTGRKVAGTRARTDRLFDPSAVYGACRWRSPQAIVAGAHRLTRKRKAFKAAPSCFSSSAPA